MAVARSSFHLAIPVHCIDAARRFYRDILGCSLGRSSSQWQDFNLYGHQLVCHHVGSEYKARDYYNPVDCDDVPVPHFGVVLEESQFIDLSKRLQERNVEFIINPHKRFGGQPGEQWTMFFKDPSGNNLEFKAMTITGNLFASYDVT
ncbi:hypothetical protein IE077_004082 [Cardiosporidium cionae]|uniref:Glyoxalase/fosfomycin resistance/dioxygenase domain-containing protein n=1 Tax=Cardiosporidium cionae TaxID=476202 RepID=A0ABQ7J6U8_9APIC|nr:hypothetical protein IE077_004082 [Cardiosporidium cionae]|eukprot:KAF8819710.1 hypothetical protein IE077_004082 [Cardiosporidium cionae]